MEDKLPDPNIKHVVILMLENRGFDHIMGWLFPSDGPQPTLDPQALDQGPFIGLSSMTPEELAALANLAPQGPSTPRVPINRGARSPKTPSYNTGESFEHIFNQMWGVAEEGEVWKTATSRAELLDRLQANGPAPMDGYVLDYDLDVFHHARKRLGSVELSEVMDTYTPEQMPVLSSLARAYAVSDKWFCSVPSQTNTNRAFAMAGTSRGLVNNSFYDAAGPDFTWPPSKDWLPGLKWPPLSLPKNGSLLPAKWLFKGSNADTLPVSTRSLFEVLQSEGLSWKVFWQNEWPPMGLTGWVSWQYTRTMLPLLQDKQFDPNFVKFDADDVNSATGFYGAARDGKLPALSWIEPKWGGGPQWDTPGRLVGNDYHPVSDTTVGEDFVAKIYNALASSPCWENTLLIITFDENGGTYDHFLPPAAPPPGNEACPFPEGPGLQPVIQPSDIEAPPVDQNTRKTQFGFDFAQYGIRVPTILVSPQVPPNTLFRSTGGGELDHASMIATVLKLAQVDPERWQLGERVAQAPTFEHLFGQNPPNLNPVSLSVPELRSNGPALQFNQPYYLQYVGRVWGDLPGPTYLGPSARGKATTYYPTFTADPTKATPYTFIPTGGGESAAPVTNMSVLRISTTETAYLGYKLLTASWTSSTVFFGRDGAARGAQWEIRILSSRDRTDTVRVGDLVYFVSRLEPAVYQDRIALTTPDPMQRLLPWPDDPTYATTRAGEWGLWKVVAAPEGV